MLSVEESVANKRPMHEPASREGACGAFAVSL